MAEALLLPSACPGHPVQLARAALGPCLSLGVLAHAVQGAWEGGEEKAGGGRSRAEGQPLSFTCSVSPVSQQQAWPQLPLSSRGSDSEKSKEKAESRRSIYWDFSDSRMAGRLPPRRHAVLRPQGSAQGQTPPHTSPGRAALEGGVGKGDSMLGWGAGTGGETCTLTSWLDPSPQGPGVAPQTLEWAGRRASCNK